MSREIISPEAGEVSGTQLPMDGTTHAQLWRIAFFLCFFFTLGAPGKWKTGKFPAGVAEGIWSDLFALYTPRLHGSFIHSSSSFFSIH